MEGECTRNTTRRALFSLFLVRRRPRMGLIIDPHELFELEMGVALGGAETGVAQEFLHTAQVSARGQKMGGKTMP